MNTVPKDFLCPITRELMINPVLLIEDGRSYEKSALEKWLQAHNTSPMTNCLLKDRRFVLNYNLKSAIEDYQLKQDKINSLTRFRQFNIKSGRLNQDFERYYKLKIRISLLGGSNVGKTTISKSIEFGEHHQTSTATVGPDLIYFYLDQLFEDEYVVVVQLQDIPGMERYEAICDNHFRHCHGAILISDITDLDSLERLQLYWYKSLQQKGMDNVETILVCNKIDLMNQCDKYYRRTYIQRAKYFASEYDIPIFHCSGLTGENIQIMFKQLIMRILNNSILLQQLKQSAIRPAETIRTSSVSTTDSIHLIDRSDSRNSNDNEAKSNCC
ncbi:unnamed protein product [Didymodactylos carnosus]|uniref:U-box domain-containing protein n=1 Tax=Didymodactylos carnosus TaxID=1234261 RepID=A0A813X9U7_9BILA|nr:unnamed protein product [Didymodactylos carnosus]CAF3657282.1 unnamed protein product [Didymodactylos carnosus]